MNLKLAMVLALLVIILISFITFGYVVHAMYQDTTNKTGADLVKGHQMLLYVQLAGYLLTLCLGAGIFYKG